MHVIESSVFMLTITIIIYNDDVLVDHCYAHTHVYSIFNFGIKLQFETVCEQNTYFIKS